MTEVRLIVASRAYSSWKSISVTRSIESISGSFALTVSDRSDLPIRNEDRCQVKIGDETLIDGYVERNGIRIDKSTHDISFSGYDKAQAIVANSALLDRWTFRKTDLLTMARELAKPFDVKVSLASGLQLPPTPDKVAVSPGDSAFDAVIREAAKAGILLVSDGAGGILLTRGGTARAEPIVEGNNFMAGDIEFDSSERYHRYVVLASRPGDDNSSGDATRIRGEAFDTEVRRKDRVKVIRPSTAMTNAQAKAHADWQARTRAALAESPTITVQGWQQPLSQKLWPVNHLSHVQASAMRIDGDLLIAEANYTLDNDDGEITRLRLVRPDAFTPDPSATVRGAEKWKQTQ